MTDPTSSDASDRLAARIGDVHVPEPKADRERLLLQGGFALVVVGVLLIVFAWFQASGTAVVAEQIPYAISGGLVGLALVIAGSALVVRFSLARLFRFWLARIVYEHQVQTDRTVEALGRIEEALTGRAPTAPPSSAASPTVDATDRAAGSPPRRRRTEPLRAEPLEKS